MKYFPLTPVQKVDLIQNLCVFLHPQSANIAISVYLDKNIDLDLLKKALDIEIERNDCLRLQFKMFGPFLRQYFVFEKHFDNIPFDDFSEKTEEDFIDYIKTQNSIPLRLLKGESYRLRFFRAPDGRFGIYGTFSHLALDTIAIFIFYKDLLCVYKSLRDKTELPKPLYRYEDAMQKDFEIFRNKEKHRKNVEFYNDYFTREKPSFFAGVDQMRDLKKTRKFFNSPDFRGAPIVHLFNDNSNTVKCHIDKETIDEMVEFCREKKISLQALFQLGIRTHLSKVNENADDVSLFITVGRRPTLADQNSGGSRVLAHILRTDFGNETTFSDALSLMSIDNFKLFRHSDYSSIAEIIRMSVCDKRFVYFTAIPMLFTFFPKEMFSIPEGVECEFFGLGTGHFVYSQYTMILPNLKDGGYDCYYEHQTRSITDDDVLLMHENMVKAIKFGIKNPDLSIEHILNEVL